MRFDGNFGAKPLWLWGFERWARFRFSVIGPLLAAPPERGELQEQLKSLAAKKWHHPITGQRVQFGLSTIERWFYTARNEKKDPVGALRRKIRSDQGGHPALSPKVRELLTAQYHQHPNWSYQLHVDNLAVLIEKEPTLGAVPSYASVMRFMKVHGLIKRPRRGPVHSPGARATEHRIEAREIRSFESEYVNALWHLDFHHGSLRVLLDKGAKQVLTRLISCFPGLKLVWADGGYAGKLVDWVATVLQRTLSIVKRPRKSQGFRVLQWRWIVERTFGWLNRSRRLSKDFDALPETTEAWIRIAMVQLMTRRLAAKT